MKKFRICICRMLIKICKWILPESAEAIIPQIDGYTASKVGMSLRYSDSLIQKLTDEMQGNKKEARKFVLDDAKANITNSIFNAIVEKKMIKYRVSYPQIGEIKVSGELKVYVPNE